MSFKNTYILFGVLVGLLAVLGLTLYMDPTRPDTSLYVFPSLHRPTDPVAANDIDSLTIERGGDTPVTLSFVRDADTKLWKMTGPYPASADQNAVGQVVSQLLAAQREEKRSVPESSGLAEPRITVTFGKGEQTWKLEIGEETGKAFDSVVYVRPSDPGTPSMAVLRSQLDSVFRPVVDFRDRSLLADTAFDLNELKISEGGKTLALKKKDTARWEFVQPGYGEADYEGAPANPGATAPGTVTGVRSLLEVVAGLRVDGTQDFVADDAADLAKYGLEADKPAGMTIEVQRIVSGFGADGKTISRTLLIGKKAEQPGQVYARLAENKNVVRINAAPLETLRKVLADPTPLRDRDLVRVDATKVDALDITHGDVKIQLRKPDATGWMIAANGGTPQRADSAQVENLIRGLTERRLVQEFPDPKSSDTALGLDKPTATVSLWVEGLPKPEKKEGDKTPAFPAPKEETPTVKLTFGGRSATQKDIVYVRRETGKDKLLLALYDGVQNRLMVQPIAFLDRTLAAVPPVDAVTRIVTTRNAQTFEVVRDSQGGSTTWKLKQPGELAGRTASEATIRNMVDSLRFLQVERFVAEKPTAADLNQKYGLEPPVLKVTITSNVGDKTEDRTYTFGKEAGTGQVFATASDRPGLVFATRADILVPLQAQLLDPTVFTFAVDRLKTLKLSGWQEFTGVALTLELQRKSATEWAASSPANFEVDPSKAETFLANLATFRADEFLPPGTMLKPEVFDLKSGALEITLLLDGEKEPITLTIGTLDETKQFYQCRSNRLPAQFFKVRKERFETYKAKPASLGK